jgi:hypothetical protein
MREKLCIYCKKEFRPSRYRPDQRVCSESDCQRRRRTVYHRRKLAKDPGYRDQCRDSQKKWREKNPEYTKAYRASRQRTRAVQSHLVRRLSQLLDLAKNNVAFDLRSLNASVWFVCPNGLINEENTLVSAQVIVVETVSEVARSGGDV